MFRERDRRIEFLGPFPRPRERAPQERVEALREWIEELRAAGALDRYGRLRDRIWNPFRQCWESDEEARFYEELCGDGPGRGNWGRRKKPE